MKKLKKLMLTALLVLSGAFAVSGVASCGHQHAFGKEEVTKQATCIEEGVKTFTCECGKSYTEKIEKIAHTPEIVKGYGATCSTEGLSDGEICSVCYAVLTEQTKIPKNNNHTYEDGVCKACSQNDPEAFEDITYVFNPSTCETGATEGTFGPFTIAGAGVRNRNRSFNLDDGTPFSATKSIKVNGNTGLFRVTPQSDGTVYLYVQNGSSGVTTQILEVTVGDPTSASWTLDKDKTADADDIQYSADGIQCIKYDVRAGETYTFACNGTTDIYYAHMTCTVKKAPIVGIEIAETGNVDYLEGEELDLAALRIETVTGNGVKQALANSAQGLVIDSSTFNKDKEGTYTIKIKYNDFDEVTYDVNVYGLDSVVLGHNGTYKGDSTSAGNSAYINKTTKTVYVKGESYSSDGLTVKAIGKLGDKQKTFYLDSTRYVINSDALASATISGEYDIVVTVEVPSIVKSVSYKVSYVDTAVCYDEQANEVNIVVDSKWSGAEGEISANANCFTSLTKALQYLEKQNTVPASAIKKISISTGYYNEKVEVTLPNVHIVGAGSTQNATTITEKLKNTATIFEWNSLYGQEDESGYVQVTDSTATFNVRDTAYGFKAKGVTFSNYYNCIENFEGMPHDEHRALAMLIQADQVTLEDCALIGYQDTVQFFTGRQYLKNCFISGTTDFIFGTNNTTLFEGCTIYSVTAETSKGEISSDGGYITAFKGMNKGAQDAIEYGAIFYKCTFNAAENVLKNKNTAIGRTWGAYSAVATIECNLGAHVSTTGYSSGASKNARYVKMNADPDAETVKFVEYGNTGEGALTEEVNGMTMLTADQAKNYYDFTVIFGVKNGGVVFEKAWIPV